MWGAAVTVPLHRRDPSRWVDRRSQYIVQEYGVRERLARAMSWSELGYSSPGIAKQLEVTEGTVRGYLDEIEERYGREAVYPKPADERGELVPVEDQPVRRPADEPEAGRQVVVEGEASGPHTIERYFRTWRRDGRIQRDGKVAIQPAEYDEQRSNALGALEWEDHHARWDDEYEFASARDTVGAWTFDADGETLAAVRDLLHLPELGELPVVASVRRRVCPQMTRLSSCEACGAAGVHSECELSVYPSLSGSAVKIVERSDVVTHLCVQCRTLYGAVPTAPVDDGDDELSISEAMR